MYIYIFWGLSLDFAVPHVHLHILGSVLGFCCPSCTFTYFGVCPWILLSLMYVYIFWVCPWILLSLMYIYIFLGLSLDFAVPHVHLYILGSVLDFAVPCKKGRLRMNHTLKNIFYHITKTTVISLTHTYLLESQTEVLVVQTGRLGHLLQKSWSTLTFTSARESDCSGFHRHFAAVAPL